MEKAVSLFGLCVLLFSGCGSSLYTPPSLMPKTFMYNIAGTQEVLFGKTRSVLQGMGFDMAVEDPATGIIRTLPKDLKVMVGECDCGMLKKKPFTQDPASTISVSLEIQIKDGSIRFVTTFAGRHSGLKGRIDRKAECVSTGAYEKQLVDMIIRKQSPP